MTDKPPLCVGCGHRPVHRPHTYCHTCRWRLETGYVCIDVDDIPSKRECARAIRRVKALTTG